MSKKLRKIFLFFELLFFNWLQEIFAVTKRNLSSAVNVLTNTPNISHITKTDIFQVIFPEIDEKYNKSALMQIFSSVWDPLLC